MPVISYSIPTMHLGAYVYVPHTHLLQTFRLLVWQASFEAHALYHTHTSMALLMCDLTSLLVSIFDITTMPGHKPTIVELFFLTAVLTVTIRVVTTCNGLIPLHAIFFDGYPRYKEVVWAVWRYSVAFSIIIYYSYWYYFRWIIVLFRCFGFCGWFSFGYRLSLV